MKLFRVDEIVLGPIDIIAHDRDHAARIFITALIDGLKRHPGADFAISEWTVHRLSRFNTLQQWSVQELAGVVWPSRDGHDWEHVEYPVSRD